jgi:ABC-2 type transport system permease protein
MNGYIKTTTRNRRIVMPSLKKYWVTFTISLQNNLVYAASFVTGLIFYALIIFIFINLWKIIYLEKDLIAGFTYNQVIWYCIITELVTISTGGNMFRSISDDIKNGAIGYNLNKPYNYIFYNLSNSMGGVAVRLLFNGIVGIILGLCFVGGIRGFNVLHLPLMLFSIVSGIMLNLMVFSSIAMTAFWFEENAAFFWIAQKIMFMGGMFFPLDMLPGWLRNIAIMLPFSYVTYAPARAFVKFSHDDFLWMTAVQAAYIVLLTGLNLLIYRKGVKAVNVNGG